MRYSSLKEIARDALEAQMAVNFSGVAHSLADMCSYLRVRENLDSNACASHPAVILMMDKLHDLQGRPGSIEYAASYEACIHLANS